MNNILNKKTCNNCLVEKNLNDFYVNNKTKDGYRPQCILCFNKKRKKTIKKNFDFKFINDYDNKVNELRLKILASNSKESAIELMNKLVELTNEYIMYLKNNNNTFTFDFCYNISKNLETNSEIIEKIKSELLIFISFKKNIIMDYNKIIVSINKNKLTITLPDVTMELNLMDEFIKNQLFALFH